MGKEFAISFWEQNKLIRDIESLKKGVEITVFNAEEARARGIKSEKENKIDDTKSQKDIKRHRRQRAEAKKQYVKHK